MKNQTYSKAEEIVREALLKHLMISEEGINPEARLVEDLGADEIDFYAIGLEIEKEGLENPFDIEHENYKKEMGQRKIEEGMFAHMKASRHEFYEAMPERTRTRLDFREDPYLFCHSINVKGLIKHVESRLELKANRASSHHH